MVQGMNRPLIAAVLVLAALAAGCVSTQPVGPQSYVNEGGLGYDEVVTMIAANKPQAEIIAQIRARGMRHAPGSADMEALRAGGASQEVLDAVIAVTWQPSSRVAEAAPGVGYAPGYYSAWPGYYGTWPGYYHGPAVGFGYYRYYGRPWGHHTHPHWAGHPGWLRRRCGRPLCLESCGRRRRRRPRRFAACGPACPRHRACHRQGPRFAACAERVAGSAAAGAWTSAPG